MIINKLFNLLCIAVAGYSGLNTNNNADPKHVSENILKGGSKFFVRK